MRQSLIEIMPVMFIPAGVGLECMGSAEARVDPDCVITVVTTVLVMAVTAKVTQTVIHNSKKKKEKAEQETVDERVFSTFRIFGAAVNLIGYERQGCFLKRKFKMAI